ncbi:MAG TPA: dienelactone hydrolase family protein [Candidatus Krumholzibacteria bacterium]|nr:dienelactone hydrolase family protein [Candidatus Krumholzibacteria bacterium]
MKAYCLSMIAAACLVSTARAEVKMDPVDYTQGDTTLKGFVVYDEAVSGKRPGVIVVHEWWGLNDYPRERAKMLVQSGYVAFVADMFGDGKTTEHPQEAGEWAGALAANRETAKARFMAAYDVFRKNARVDPDKIAAIGYCMGGSVVLRMAYDGVDLDGVASFHGGLFPEPAAGPVKASILVCHGAADGFMPDEVVQQFQKNLAASGADYQFISYGGAKHSFTNPGADKRGIAGIEYNAAADRRSWAALLDFLGDVLK